MTVMILFVLKLQISILFRKKTEHTILQSHLYHIIYIFNIYLDSVKPNLLIFCLFKVQMRTGNLVVSDVIPNAATGSSFIFSVFNSHLQIWDELMHMQQAATQVCVLQLNFVHARLWVWGLHGAPELSISLPGHCWSSFCLCLLRMSGWWWWAKKSANIPQLSLRYWWTHLCVHVCVHVFCVCVKFQ